MIARDTDQLGGNDSTAKVLEFLEARILRDGQHPLDPAHALLGIDQVADLDYFQAAFEHPVQASQARIKGAVFDIPCHFLGTNEQAFDLGIICGSKIRAGVGVHAQSGAREQAQRRLLQTSFGDAQSQFHRSALSCPPNVVPSAVPRGSSCVKQERVPVWQTLPSPSTRTRSRTVSRSQSAKAATTCRRLPELSPLVHSVWRVRL